VIRLPGQVLSGPYLLIKALSWGVLRMNDRVTRRLCWRRRHETVLQWFLKYPSGLRSDCARATGYSTTHISRITRTEEFNTRIEKAFDAANDQIARDQILNQILNGPRWGPSKKYCTIGHRVVPPIPQQRVMRRGRADSEDDFLILNSLGKSR
jgi:hypothetical protein